MAQEAARWPDTSLPTQHAIPQTCSERFDKVYPRNKKTQARNDYSHSHSVWGSACLTNIWVLGYELVFPASNFTAHTHRVSLSQEGMSQGKKPESEKDRETPKSLIWSNLKMETRLTEWTWTGPKSLKIQESNFFSNSIYFKNIHAVIYCIFTVPTKAYF